MKNKGRIGIITGAGPSAGMDLWEKIINHTKEYYREKYRGDVDAPYVVIYSVPELGEVMNIERKKDDVWSHLKDTLLRMENDVDYFCIACNILHYYTPHIKELNLKAKFISIIDITKDYLFNIDSNKIALLSISKIIELGEFSPYSILKKDFTLEIPSSEEMDLLIRNIKIKGPENVEVIQHYKSILSKINSNIILLACTELPLIKSDFFNKTCIDPTDLLAKSMAYHAIGKQNQKSSQTKAK
jgi:aspartate racemase